MANTFYLEIITPERIFFSGQALSLILPALDGQHGVMAGHEPMVTAVESGVLKYRSEDGQWHRAAVSRGFAEVMPEYAILLVSTAEHPAEIDAQRAHQAMDRAERRLHTFSTDRAEYGFAREAMDRARARLQAKDGPEDSDPPS